MFSEDNGKKLGINNKEIWGNHEYVENVRVLLSPVPMDQRIKRY